MTQNLRVARYVPIADPAQVGDNIVTTNPPTPNKSISTKFTLAGGAGAGIPEAPSDGNLYARRNASWNAFSIPASTVPEAPTDGQQYARQSAAWHVVTMPAIIDGGTF